MVERQIGLPITSGVGNNPKEDGNPDAIQMQNPVPAEILNGNSLGGERAFRRTPQMKKIENQHNGTPIDSILEDLYLSQKKSTRQIGKELDESMVTILSWLDRAGVKTRSVRDGMLAWHAQRQSSEISAVKKNSPTKIKLAEVKKTFEIDSEEKIKAFLRRMFKKNHSLAAMARAFEEKGINVCSDTVGNWMSQFEIDLNVLREENDKNLVKRSVRNGDFQQLTEKQRNILESRGFFRKGLLTPFRKLPEVQSGAITYQTTCAHEKAALKRLRILKDARSKTAQAGVLRRPVGRPKIRMRSDLIGDLYSKKGLSIHVIAKMRGRSVSTINDRLRRKGTQIRPVGRPRKQTSNIVQ